jgi:hypothetical protein
LAAGCDPLVNLMGAIRALLLLWCLEPSLPVLLSSSHPHFDPAVAWVSSRSSDVVLVGEGMRGGGVIRLDVAQLIVGPGVVQLVFGSRAGVGDGFVEFAGVS